MAGLMDGLMLQTGTRTRLGDPDVMGAQEPESVASTPCQAIRRQERVKTADGTLVLCSAVVYVPGDFDVAAGDRWQTAGWSEEHQVLAVADVPDLWGAVDHRKVWLDRVATGRV